MGRLDSHLCGSSAFVIEAPRFNEMREYIVVKYSSYNFTMLLDDNGRPYGNWPFEALGGLNWRFGAKTASMSLWQRFGHVHYLANAVAIGSWLVARNYVNTAALHKLDLMGFERVPLFAFFVLVISS